MKVTDMSNAPAAATFTMTELNRQPAKVLAAVRKFGSAEIRTRTGEVFTFAPKVETKRKQKKSPVPDFPAHWKRLRELGLVPPPASENDRINRIIAGEE